MGLRDDLGKLATKIRCKASSISSLYLGLQLGTSFKPTAAGNG